MTVALLARYKLKFVTNKILQPALNDDEFDAWCRCNIMVISWILYAVSNEIADNIMYLDDDLIIWSELHEHFHQNNGSSII